MSSHFLDALAGTRLYPVTDRNISGLSHADQVSELTQGGVKLVQLREKAASPLDFYAEAEAALRVAREHGLKVIINDRVDLALTLNAAGVHLGQDDLPPEAARQILGPDAIIGFSTHNLPQALLAATMPIDYIAIGPIFATTTKVASNTPVGLESLRLIREVVGMMPLVAIGGITSDNSASVLSAGADAVAVIRGIWSPPDQIATNVQPFLVLP